MPSKRIVILLMIVLLLVVNGWLFVRANTIPLDWQQDEIIFLRYFFSIDLDRGGLRSGLAASDLLKILMVDYLDEGFRWRPVSYLAEMLSFKFWQFWGMAFTRDYTLIILHVCNALLLGLAVRRLSGQGWVGLAAGVLFLNSGVGLATLLFPFRNAKILSVTFLLAAWFIQLRGPRPDRAMSPRRLAAFSAFVLLALLSDETALFFCPVFILSAAGSNGWEGLFRRRGVLWAAAIAAVFGVIVWRYYVLVGAVMSRVPAPLIHEGLARLGRFWAWPRSLWDIALSSGGYFLPRNFGYWDFSFSGLLAAGGFLTLLVWGGLKPAAVRCRWTAVILLSVLLAKTVLLPHISGVHPGIMPKGTVFPSLLFFSYYYPYLDSFLAVAALMLFVSAPGSKLKPLIVLICITLMAVSNTAHLREGPADALAFHLWDRSPDQNIIRDVRAAKEFVDQHPRERIFLSYPGTASQIGRREFLKDYPSRYSKLGPVVFFKSGRAGSCATAFFV